MLHSRRQRVRELQEQHARGDVPWTEWFAPEARTKIRYAFERAFPDATSRVYAGRLARRLVLEDEGLSYLVSAHGKAYDHDFIPAFAELDNDLLPTFIEALWLSIKTPQAGVVVGDAQGFANAVQTILYEYSISFDFVPPMMVTRESQELHEAVVRPTLLLLQGRAEFAHAESAYQKALAELGADPADAITDAATALQEVLKALGAKGGSLGRLVKHARSSGLLSGYDENLTTALVNWTEADRSEKGDAHNAQEASREDAWLAIHVTGALMLRLASDGPREQ